jgi:hypothetical protein
VPIGVPAAELTVALTVSGCPSVVVVEAADRAVVVAADPTVTGLVAE